MKTTRLVLLAALAGVCGTAFADYSGSRDERMQAALDNYHRKNGMPTSQLPSSQGPVSRAATSIRHGASEAGDAIKRGASKAGHAIGTGLHKTGEAIDHAGQKLKGKTAE